MPAASACSPVSGAQKALHFGHGAEVAILLGVITAVGGGMARDVLLNRVAIVLRKKSMPRRRGRRRARVAACATARPAAIGTWLPILACFACAICRALPWNLPHSPDPQTRKPPSDGPIGATAHPAQIIGQAGEDAALAYLQQHGLSLLQRNFRCKGGEIDLVMREQATLVFVEVRKRAVGMHGGAAASVTPAKQRRLIIAAQIYLQRFRMPPACRFDVVAIDGTQLTWLKNAIET